MINSLNMDLMKETDILLELMTEKKIDKEERRLEILFVMLINGRI